MTAHIIDGNAIAAEVRREVATGVTSLLAAGGEQPGLAVVLVGNDPASHVYVANKVRQTDTVGMRSFRYDLPADISERDLLSLIGRLNADDAIHGILVQFPLPQHIDSRRVVATINPEKDVDGFNPLNVGRVATGMMDILTPCTPLGVMRLIRSVHDDIAGLEALVNGASNVVGRPMARLLLEAQCTVSIAHIRTTDLAARCRQADILVVATGVPDLIRGADVKPGATVIDVGITRVDQPSGKSRLVGDVIFDEAVKVAGAITPVPGGVGPMTIACLLANTLSAARAAAARAVSALHHVFRTREGVGLDDASVRNLYSDDEYVRQNHPRSVLCLPAVKQTKIVGALYLENNLTPYAFTPDRVAVLEASQATISLENARLYSEVQRENTERKRAEEELQRSESHLAEAQRLSRTGSFGWNVATGEIIWSDETFRIFGYDKGPSVTVDMVVQRTHPDDRAAVQQTIDRAARDGKDFSDEYRLLMPDGAVRYVQAVAHATKDAPRHVEFVGAVTDVTTTRRAEEALRQSQAELAHVTRLTTLGELTASIAHEVNQPLATIVTNGEVCLRWLDREVPDLAELREALRDMISNGRRAGGIIQRLRALSKRTETQKVGLDINEAINEVIPLVRQEVLSRRVSLRLELAPALPAVLGDRVQLQQVIINLIVNGMEAMAPVTDRSRDLVIRSQLDDAGQVLVTVEDSGLGIDPENAKQIFNAFFTTKPSGMGMGLSICRSIIENHGGTLWMSPRAPHGTTFRFTVPIGGET